MTEEMIQAFGDPGLNRIIKAMREAREEFDKSMTESVLMASNRTGTPPIAPPAAKADSVSQQEDV